VAVPEKVLLSQDKFIEFPFTAIVGGIYPSNCSHKDIKSSLVIPVTTSPSTGKPNTNSTSSNSCFIERKVKGMSLSLQENHEIETNF